MKICRWILLTIRNVLDTICRENRNTYFVISNFLRKIVPFISQCRKTRWRQTSHKWQHSTAHSRCMQDKRRYTSAWTCTRPRASAPTTHTRARIHQSQRARAHTHTHTQANTHTEKYLIPFRFSTATMISRRRLNVTSYVHCVCC